MIYWHPLQRQNCTSQSPQRSSPLLTYALRMVPRMKEILNDEALSTAGPSINSAILFILPQDILKCASQAFLQQIQSNGAQKQSARVTRHATRAEEMVTAPQVSVEANNCCEVFSCWKPLFIREVDWSIAIRYFTPLSPAQEDKQVQLVFRLSYFQIASVSVFHLHLHQAGQVCQFRGHHYAARFLCSLTIVT